MNSDIHKQMNHRYKLWFQLKKPTKDTYIEPYTNQETKCSALLQKQNSDYWRNKFDNSTLMKEFWSLVKSFQGK